MGFKRKIFEIKWHFVYFTNLNIYIFHMPLWFFVTYGWSGYGTFDSNVTDTIISNGVHSWTVKLMQFVAFRRANKNWGKRRIVHKSEISFLTYKAIYYPRYLWIKGNAEQTSFDRMRNEMSPLLSLFTWVSEVFVCTKLSHK